MKTLLRVFEICSGKMQQVLSEKENKMQSDKCNYCSFIKKKDLEVAS